MIICCGLPFAGKSTLARVLAASRGWTHIALNDVMECLGLWEQQEPITQAQWDTSFAIAHASVSTTLRAEQPVVYDATNHTRAERDRLRALARAAQSATRVVYVTTPPAVVRARIEMNRRQPQRGDITEEQIQYVIAHLDVPTDDEQTMVYTPDTPLTAWIEAFPYA